MCIRDSYDEMPSGAIDLELDKVLAQSSIAHALRVNVGSAIKKVETFGEIVPSAWLTEVLDDGYGAVYQDRSAKEISDTLKRFQAIISPA